MSLGRKLLVFVLGILVVYGGLSLVVDTKNSLAYDETEDHVRIFCWQNRVYLEFNRGAGTWGVAALDSEGRPIRCPRRSNLEDQIYEGKNGV